MTPDQTANPAVDERMRAPADEIASASGPADDEMQDPDETVAVEYEGRTYQVPTAVKAALMRQRDYTRKTQELAQRRKAAEALHENLVHGDKLHRLGLARLQMLDEQLAPHAQISTLDPQAPRTVGVLHHVAKLKAARDQTACAIQTHQQNQALALQRVRARQVEQGRARLRQDIEDWSPETAHRILQAGKAHGFSDEEVHSVTDPRMILVLNKARLFDEHQQRQAQAKRLTAAHAARPATEVGAAASATRDPSRMSTAEWMRWRANQLHKRK